MNDLKEQAAEHIFRVQRLKEKYEKLAEFQESLLSTDGRAVEVSLWSSSNGNDQVTICIWERNERNKAVYLNQNLGITNLQSELKEKVFAAAEVRKAEIENELKRLIGGDTK